MNVTCFGSRNSHSCEIRFRQCENLPRGDLTCKEAFESMEDSRSRLVGKLLVNDDLNKSSQIVLSGRHFVYFMGLDEVSHDWVAIQ